MLEAKDAKEIIQNLLLLPATIGLSGNRLLVEVQPNGITTPQQVIEWIRSSGQVEQIKLLLKCDQCSIELGSPTSCRWLQRVVC